MFLASNQLDAFYMVAQTLNFSRAAERLNITQSALSQRILTLEEELGLTLFIRERAGIQLTEAALSLLRYCQNRSCLEEELLSEIQPGTPGSLSGAVRIAGFSSVTRSVILPSLANLLRNHSKLKVEVLTREIGDLTPLLKRGEVDFIAIDQDLKQEGFEGSLIGYEEYVHVRSKKFSADEIFLDNDPNDKTTKSYFQLSSKDFTKLKRRYLDDIYGLIDGVRLGLGEAVLPRHLLRDLNDLVIVNPKTVLKIPVYIQYHSQGYYTKLQSAVVDEIKKNAPLLLK